MTCTMSKAYMTHINEYEYDYEFNIKDRVIVINYLNSIKDRVIVINYLNSIKDLEIITINMTEEHFFITVNKKIDLYECNNYILQQTRKEKLMKINEKNRN